MRTGARVRGATYADGGVDPGTEFEAAGAVAGAAQGGGYRAGVRYQPTVRARQPHSTFREPWQTDSWHRATFDAEFRRDGHARPFFSTAFNYGATDLTSLAQSQGTLGAGGTGAGPQAEAPGETQAPGGESPAPQAEAPQNPQAPTHTTPAALLNEFGTDTTLGVEVPLSRLCAWTLAGGFFHGGGLQAADRATVPMQTSPRLATGLGCQVSRLDWFSASADARAAWFEGGPAGASLAGEGQLLVGWRRQLWHTTWLEVRAGVAAALYRGPALSSGATSLSPWPAGSVSLNHRFPLGAHSLTVWGSASVSPFLDRFLGAAYERADGAAGFEWTFRDWLALVGRGAVSRTVGADALVGGLLTTWLDGAVSVRPVDWFRVDVYGSRSVISTRPPPPGQPERDPVWQWVAGLNLSVFGQGNF